MSTKLTMWDDGELCSRYNMSLAYQLESINSNQCNVKYASITAQENLDTCLCTSRQLSCAHAIVACRYYNILFYSLYSRYSMCTYCCMNENCIFILELWVKPSSSLLIGNLIIVKFRFYLKIVDLTTFTFVYETA